MLESIIEWYANNLLLASLASFVMYMILYRSYKTARIYVAAQSYVKKSKKLRKKKYNGILLVENIQKKRKKNTNSFQKLKRRAKNQVRKYFNYKLEELPVIRKYSYGKLLKRNNKRIVIIIRNEKKILKKIYMAKGLKHLIDATNKYECLNEMILFLHNLPDALLEKQDYDIYLNEQEVLIGYDVK
ncbi:MAG: hypothetical protein JXR62_01245 [Bacilli bacterium]|nr:hypothetical protein [Bacilli bacterium]